MLTDATLYTFIYGSCVYWACFLLCDLTFVKALAKPAIYAIIITFYVGIGILYFITSFSALTFIEYIIGFLPFVIIPLLYKDSVAKIVFTYFSSLLFCLMIHLTSNIITNHTFSRLVQTNMVENLAPDMLFRFITLCLMFFYFILVVSGLKKAFKKMLETTPNKVIATGCVLPIGAFIILLIDYVLLSDLTNMNGNVIALSTLMLLLISVYFVLFSAFTKATVVKQPNVVPEKNMMMRKEIVSDPMDLLTSGRHYYEMLLNHYIDMNKRTQLLDNNMQTMNSLLVNDNVAGATVFIDRISKAFHDHDMVPVCNNQSINLLFSYYYYLCKQEQIYLETHINLSNQMQIPDLDLCILFGNCMENAIEANGYIKDQSKRFINVDCKIQNGHLTIVIDNAFDGFINKVNNQLKSRKKFGGIGLKTVQAVVGKYQGTIDMEYPQNVFSIFVKIPLSQKAAKKDRVQVQQAKSKKNTNTKKNSPAKSTSTRKKHK